MSNKGNLSLSLGCLPLASGKNGEALGVENYPGFCRNIIYLLYGADGSVPGVATVEHGCRQEL